MRWLYRTCHRPIVIILSTIEFGMKRSIEAVRDAGIVYELFMERNLSYYRQELKYRDKL